MWRLGIFVLLASCNTFPIVPNPCKTNCGASLYGSGDCRGLTIVEEISVDVLGWYSTNICGRLKHVSVQVWKTENGSWTDNWGRRVAGLTNCDMMMIELGTDDWANSAFAHELVHLADCPAYNSNHEGWDNSGIYESIQEIKTLALTRNQSIPFNSEEEAPEFIEEAAP